MRHLYSVLLFCLIFTTSIQANPLHNIKTGDQANDKGPKVGLVLSGGGAKGIMHIELLRIFEEVNMPIDYIGGTSMGAIIGGLYAIGYSPDDLERIVINADWNRLLSDNVSRRHIPIEEKVWDAKYMLSLPIINRRIGLPSGLVAGQEISKLLTRLSLPVHGIEDFNEFPIPFVAIATDLETGLPIVMRSGYLPDVLRSSMAIPSVFSPHEIYGKITIDGGVARNFPVTDVLEMGADYVIGINVSDSEQRADTLSNIISILERTVNYQIVQTTRDQARLVDLLIQPDIGNYSMVSFDRIAEIVAVGKKEAQKYKPRLQQIADSLNALRTSKEKFRYIPPHIESLYISEIQVHNTKLTQERIVISELGIEPGSSVTPEQIELGIDRVYSLQFFETVRYRLQPTSEGTLLHVYVKEKLDDQFRVGLRYDNRNKSSLLFNATFRNTYKPTSTIRLNLRLGEETYYDTQYFYYIGYKPKLGVHLQGTYSTVRNDMFHENGDIFANIETESVKAEFWVGPVVSSMLIMGAGFREEGYQIRRRVGVIDRSNRWYNNHSFFAFLWVDTKNDATFPTNGQMIRADYTKSLKWFGNPVLFTEYRIMWENLIPISPRVTGQFDIFSSISSGDTPIHHQSYLGDLNYFPGYYKNELTGEWIKSVKLGLQSEIMKNRFLLTSIHAGQVSTVENFSLDDNPIRFGWNVTAATRTVIGPVKVSLSGSSRYSVLFDIRIGYDF